MLGGGGRGGGVSPLPWVKEHRTGVQDRYVCSSYLKGGCGVGTHYIIVVYNSRICTEQNNPNHISTFHTPSSADTYTKSYCSKNVGSSRHVIFLSLGVKHHICPGLSVGRHRDIKKER
jgi:hypothetical protein